MTVPAPVYAVAGTPPTWSPVSALVPVATGDATEDQASGLAVQIAMLEKKITGIAEVLELTPRTQSERKPESERVCSIEDKLDALIASVEDLKRTVDALQQQQQQQQQQQKSGPSSDDGSFCNISEKNPGS